MTTEIKDYPSSTSDSSLFKIALENIMVSLDKTSKEYREVLKYYFCITDKNCCIINKNYTGTIQNKNGNFTVTDNAGIPFISYKKGELKIRDYYPILFHSSIYFIKVFDHQKNKIYQSIFVEQDEYKLDLITNQKIDNQDTSYLILEQISIEEVLNITNLNCLKKDIYNIKEIYGIVKAIKTSKNLTKKEQEKLEDICIEAAKWWLEEYLCTPFELENSVANYFKKWKPEKGKTVEGKTLTFINILKEEIKAKLLKENLRCYIEAEYTVDNALLNAIRKSKLDICPIFAEMYIDFYKSEINAGEFGWKNKQNIYLREKKKNAKSA